MNESGSNNWWLKQLKLYMLPRKFLLEIFNSVLL